MEQLSSTYRDIFPELQDDWDLLAPMILAHLNAQRLADTYLALKTPEEVEYANQETVQAIRNIRDYLDVMASHRTSMMDRTNPTYLANLGMVAHQIVVGLLIKTAA